MPQWKKALAVTIVVSLVALAAYIFVNRQAARQPPAKSENRVPMLKELVDAQELESAWAVSNYHPKTPSRVDDLDISVVDLLGQLPGVVRVECRVPAKNPTHRIIHLRDGWIVDD